MIDQIGVHLEGIQKLSELKIRQLKPTFLRKKSNHMSTGRSSVQCGGVLQQNKVDYNTKEESKEGIKLLLRLNSPNSTQKKTYFSNNLTTINYNSKIVVQNRDLWLGNDSKVKYASKAWVSIKHQWQILRLQLPVMPPCIFSFNLVQ